jgi:hypothetical protein
MEQYIENILECINDTDMWKDGEQQCKLGRTDMEPVLTEDLGRYVEFFKGTVIKFYGSLVGSNWDGTSYYEEVPDEDIYEYWNGQTIDEVYKGEY